MSEIHPVAADQPPFAEFLGLKVISANEDRVEAKLTARAELMNRNGVLHGGAIMALADNMGGTFAMLLLSPGQTTTTVESKTNFFRAVPEGDELTCVSEALHKGRKTTVVQSKLYRSDGKLAAMVTQTQMVLQGRD